MTETKDGYVLSKNLIHSLIVAILTALVTIGAYMIMWNSQYQNWTARLDEKMENLTALVISNKDKLEQQILPQAKWRLDSIDDWMDEHEKEHRRLGGKFE